MRFQSVHITALADTGSPQPTSPHTGFGWMLYDDTIDSFDTGYASFDEVQKEVRPENFRNWLTEHDAHLANAAAEAGGVLWNGTWKPWKAFPHTERS